MGDYKKTGLRNTASNFAVAGCVLCSLLIIPMCWMIPMTVSIRRRIKNDEKMGLALPICYMIFGDIFALAASILLCVDYGTNKGQEQETKPAQIETKGNKNLKKIKKDEKKFVPVKVKENKKSKGGKK